MATDSPEEQAKTDQREGAAPASKTLFTAIQHGSGLLVFLGLFLAVPTYLSNPNSGLVTVGFVLALLGVAGFFVGMFMKRRQG